jgi:flagellar hook protein FlgE
MTSGVSGLAAQSSAMGAIADNISNVNTIGYKQTNVDFQTLVTQQASKTQYASGGVAARPQGAVDLQGLLQASNSETHLAISGAGFMVVNEAQTPGVDDQFLYTRAGSFQPDPDGFLRNTSGYYLQAWPTDALGNIVLPNGGGATAVNQNTISTDFLETVNLNRVSGTTAPTTQIAVGANLPASTEVGASHNIDAQFFDTLGTDSAVTLTFTKTGANTWNLIAEPPKGTSVLTLYDGANVRSSTGQIEFTARPASGTSVDVGGTTFTFGDGSGGTIDVSAGRPLDQIITDVVAAINASGAAGASLKSNSSTTVLLSSTAGNVSVDPTALNGAARQTQPFTVSVQPASPGPAITFASGGVPTAIGVTDIAMSGFTNGAGDMDGSASGGLIDLNLGTTGKADGLTQFTAEFSPKFIEQDGSRYGEFTGVNIDGEGLMYALFDNGQRRPIYRIPLATFVSPNGMQSVSGNAWFATMDSGNPTLREAGSGAAGSLEQSALESSTVDIGDEFTRMIVVQRAYSAATRIISTADEMLEELVRIKR